MHLLVKKLSLDSVRTFDWLTCVQSSLSRSSHHWSDDNVFTILSSLIGAQCIMHKDEKTLSKAVDMMVKLAHKDATQVGER